MRLPGSALVTVSLFFLLISLAAAQYYDDDDQVGPSWTICYRLGHLDVEDCSEELIRQQSYVIKNQLGHPKPPNRGFGTQNTPIGGYFTCCLLVLYGIIGPFPGSELSSSIQRPNVGSFCLLLAGCLWHKDSLLSCTESSYYGFQKP